MRRDRRGESIQIATCAFTLHSISVSPEKHKYHKIIGMYVGLDVQIVRIQTFLKVLVQYQPKLRWLLLRNAIDLIVCYNTTILGSPSRLWAMHFLRNCTVPSKYEVLFNVFKELCIHVVRTLFCLVWIWYTSFILILRCYFIAMELLTVK